jgi:acetyl-CoA carboxylase biotin carboxyl carrier protein
MFRGHLEIVYNRRPSDYTYRVDLKAFNRKGAAMAQKDTDLQKIEELIEIMEKRNLVEVEIKHGEDKILLKRFQPYQPVAAVPVIAPAMPAGAVVTPPAGAVSTAEVQQNLVEIKSSVVGTFYSTPSPDSESYVEIGSQVEPQTVVCIIEAMKVMNEIKAETRGTIAEVLITNGQAVQYGQVLFRVKPD